MLARLLELNAERAREEARSGAAGGPTEGGRQARPVGKKRTSARRRTRRGTSSHDDPDHRPSREIDGKGRTIRELLAGRKYSIDYYQREYKWQQKQVAELLDDLAAKFLRQPRRGQRAQRGRRVRPLLPGLDHHQRQGRPEVHHRRPAAAHHAHAAPDLPAAQLEDAEQKGQIAELIFSQKLRQAVVQPRRP